MKLTAPIQRTISVIPAEAGIYCIAVRQLDSRLRGNTNVAETK